MLTKKLTVLAAALALSAPAFADNGNHYGHYRHGHYDRHGHERRVVVVQQPHYYYRPAPRPVVVYQPVYRPVPVYQPVYQQPRPAYYHTAVDPNTGAALLLGGLIGAAIVHAAVTGH